ncbi:hypothetical protein QWJ90_14130 [Microbacterium oryzae]|uniref:hypothetical protein n=1 Tax=Microbacterium oryzae TaxID=743009 RepID=UPI0025B0E565|nr:hypothetical protein [Microbacterium oryzae]MDN3312068.1 hypothetical protein [Microbacterium oryzae]
MASKGIPSARVISADDEGIEAAFRSMASAIAGLRQGETLLEFAARGPQVIQENVAAISEALEQADAFDVIELMRLRETPLVLDGYRESLADQRPAAVELVALILLARGERTPEGADTRKGNPAAEIPDLHDRCGAMLSMGQFMLLSDGRDDKYGPLTTLAATYVGHDVNVKFKQYAHVHDGMNEALFGTEHIGDLLLGSLGFSYEDFVAVRTAIREVYLDRFFAARDTLGEIAQEWSDSGRAEQPEDRIEQGRAAVHDLMFFPGKRASFTASDIAAACNLGLAHVEQVLQRFSVPFGAPSDPVAIVESYLAGNSPFRNAALVVDGEGNYISLNVPIGTDCFRQVVEATVKADAAKWKRYEKRRVAVSEQLAVEHLETLLGTSATYVNLKYFRPNPGIDVTQLGADAVKITSIAEQTEADALFLVEDVAVCVEVKGRSVSHRARGGHVQRLAGDLRATVGEATEQALRLERLIRTNGGLWDENQQWLDLTSIRELRSVAVCLDDMGPLATALDELVRAGVVKSDRFPWIVSLHDLAIVAEVVDRPAEFLLYLRRRTESEVSLNFAAIDELDLFMLFLSGQLYVEPDPDRVSEEFLGVRRPTAKDRRRYRGQSVPTRVMTHTDPLDAWVYFREGSSQEEAPKPEFSSHPALLGLVDFLQDGRKPGWFRFSSDLLNLADEAQEDVVRGIDNVIEATKKDGQPHTSFVAFAGAWGYPTLFVGSQPAKMPRALASHQLATYGITKKHQIQSDRALMVLVDERGAIRSVRYDNRRPAVDAELDQLATEMGLIPVEVMGRPVPPSARRATKRLNPGKKKRKR